MKTTKTNHIVLTVVTIILITSNSFAQIIGPGYEGAAYEGNIYIIDSLLISGTLVFANQPGDPPTHAPHTIIITNGDFILAAGGLITQQFDYAFSPGPYSTNGVNGADGMPPPPYNGQPGAPGLGNGSGGWGGNGYSPTFPADSQPIGGQGGAGGPGGDISGLGGFGGWGGNGSSGNTSINPGSVDDGGVGGFGGWGGYGAGDYTIFIINETCGGKIDVSQGSVSLGGTHGGYGRKGASGGNGGSETGPSGPGANGAAGGNGGYGGAGGNGSSLTLISSNGFVYISNFKKWLPGNKGGDGGMGGAGGNGGNGTGGMLGGNGGNGGNGGSGGDGGQGGFLNILSSKIFTNSIQVGSTVGSLDNAGQPGVNDPGGASGGLGGFTNGTPGSAGSAGSGTPMPGFPGDFAFTADIIPPNFPVMDPVLAPPDESILIAGTNYNLVFFTLTFSDNMTKQSCLRHTIQIVPTDNVFGPALETIGTDIYNIPENTNLSFTAQASWVTNDYLYFRFLTYDKADNVASNVYPTETIHDFKVIPEPGIIMMMSLVAICTMRRVIWLRRH